MGVSYSVLDAVTGLTIPASWGDNVKDSVVTTHASYSATTSAITSPTQGAVSFLTDTNTFWYYRSSNWRTMFGQYLYCKWDTSTSFATNLTPGGYSTVFTSATFNIPSSGTGQAYRVMWSCPHSSGAVTKPTMYNSLIQTQINGGSFNTAANAGPVVTNSNDTDYVSRGEYIYKAGGSDTTLALRMQSIAVSAGTGFDCIAKVNIPFVLTLECMGLLASEIT